VLVEGRYSGVLEPERHYIPLRRDFSNLDEALERLGDVEAVEAMAERAYRDVYLSGRSNLTVLAGELCEEAEERRRGRVAVPFALARRPSLPVRAPREGKPVRRLLPHLVTLAGSLARQREARELFLAARRGRVDVPLEDVVRELVLLRVLARIRDDGGSRGERWSLDVESSAGTIVIRTRVGSGDRPGAKLDGPFERVAWNHADVAQAVPIFPRHPGWGWIALGPYGRYEFSALGEVARTDPGAARALLARALER
jgi:hypothetical protein